ncbi:hypothetical protein PV797_09660 [Clostridiaceae bacterium M8S5]|nr:hypothetical protein PV797_09660 [Clostridiaceae bacterium M8S5]
MSNFKESIKRMFSDKDKKNSNIIFLLVIGILLLIGSVYFSTDGETTGDIGKVNSDIASTVKSEQSDDTARFMEDKLKNILSKIKGVGNVEVMVTLEDTTERIPAINKTITVESTNEKDYQGGTRSTNKQDEINEIVTKSSNEGLVILKEIKPKVKGVIVVAGGIEDMKVKEDIYLAVKTVLGITGNKVEVFLSK